MNRVSVKRAINSAAAVIAATQILAVGIGANDAAADFAVPNCATLEKFGLDYFNYKTARIQAVFGLSLGLWTNDELAAFRKGFTDCRKQNPKFMWRDFAFETSVVMASNDIARRVNAYHKQQRNKTAEVSVSPEVAALLKKHRNMAPGRNFLASKFRTYAGVAATKDVATVIEFYDKVDGKKRWESVGGAWVLIVDGVNAATGQSATTRVVFKDMRPEETYIWLDSVTIDGNTLATPVVTYMIREMFH